MTGKGRLGHDPLSGGGPSWITDTRPKEEPREKKPRKKAAAPRKEPTTTSQAGLEAGWTRATVIVRESHLKKLKLQALRDGKPIKAVLDEILAANYKGKKIKVEE